MKALTLTSQWVSDSAFYSVKKSCTWIKYHTMIWHTFLVQAICSMKRLSPLQVVLAHHPFSQKDAISHAFVSLPPTACCPRLLSRHPLCPSVCFLLCFLPWSPAFLSWFFCGHLSRDGSSTSNFHPHRHCLLLLTIEALKLLQLVVPFLDNAVLCSLFSIHISSGDVRQSSKN